MQTHERFIAEVATLAIAQLPTVEDRVKLEAVKLVYGAGKNGVRGVTYYNKWQPKGAQPVPFVELGAFTQENYVQLAGTTIHELGHVLAGMGAGHSKVWKEACEALGLRKIKAAGTCYCLAHFVPQLRNAIATLRHPDDGQPVTDLGTLGFKGLRACPVGVGTRGGKSRGKGSGSRLRLWQCPCGVKARVASDDFQAIHVPCNSRFTVG